MSTTWKRYRSGDKEAFTVIYHRYRKPLLKYVACRLSDPEAAEEVCQEIFMKVHRFNSTFDESQEFSSWLWTIARNTVFDALRKVQNAKAQLEPLQEDLCSVDESTGPIEEFELLFEKKNKHVLFKTMLKSLTKLQRRVIWMRIVQERSYAEISKHLGISLSSVKNLAYRAKLSLTQSCPSGPALAAG